MFCPNCGSSVSGAFCSKCGRQITTTSPSAASPSPAPPSPASNATVSPPLPPGSSGSKIIFTVVGVLVALGLLGMVAAVYVGHKVKQVASEYGVDLSSRSSEQIGRAHSYDACALLSKDEAAQILGTPIASVKLGGRGITSRCEFYPASASADDVSGAIDRLKELGNQPDSAKKNGEVQDAISRMARGAITDPSSPILTIAVDGRSGRSNMTSFAGAYRILSGVTKGSGIKAAEDISGIGDRAVLGAVGNMMFLKGDTSVELDGPAVLGSKDKATALAQRIVSRL